MEVFIRQSMFHCRTLLKRNWRSVERVCWGNKPFVRFQSYKKFWNTLTWRRGFATLCVVPVVHAVVGLKSHSKKDEGVIKEADVLYYSNNVDGLYRHLINCTDTENPDILWRLARATCDKAKSTTDSAARKQLMFDAFKYAQRALEVGEDNFACHKWYSIMLDYIGEYEGTKERISKAYEIKEHFLRAIELNPSDATSIHLLGYWCFVFADLPWYQQKIAAVLFATPPSSSYQEALQYFDKAEKTDPNFYSMNLLMLGKCHLRLNNKELAKEFLTKARDYPVRTEDDKKAHKEATDLLNGL